MSIAVTVRNEAANAARLLTALRDLSLDETETADAIEGETGLVEAIGLAVDRLSALDAMTRALDLQIESLEARKSRLKDQHGKIRLAVLEAMAEAGMRKLELPAATVFLRKSVPHVVVIDDAAIPEQFWIPQPPKLDKKKLAVALKDGNIPGASLSNITDSLNISKR